MGNKVFFENKKGLKLCGIFSDPTNDVGKPMVVFCHGHSTSKDSTSIKKLSEILNSKNVSTFRFDVSGHGESEGKFEETTVSDAMNDILSAIEYVKSLGYSKIGLVGSSFGGAASILAAAKSPDLFVLALKAPVSDYKRLKITKMGINGVQNWEKQGYMEYEKDDERGLRLKYSFFEDFDNFNEYEAAKNITAPTIIVHGDSDNDVPVEQSIKLATIIPNCKLEVVSGADHGFSNPENFEKMLKLIPEFILEKL
ncbi:MAG TPA: alpha/beta fold hydrolase [Candidatus Moranbacteria bacterium]|nr:alpha/beta fold hydrolase [Candidatus Moranbacteria bacterium]